MIQITLPFDNEEQQENCNKALDWLQERLGDPVHMTEIHQAYLYHSSWRYMSPDSRRRVFDYLSVNGGWLICGDVDYDIEDPHHFQQFLISDPNVAILFKLTWA